MSRCRSSVKDGDHAEAITRGALEVEEGTCQDHDEVRSGSHHDVQDVVELDSGLVKGDYTNWGRSLDLTRKVACQYEGDGDTSSKEEKSEALIELQTKTKVSTPDPLTDASMDGSPSRSLHYQEQTVKDGTDENWHLEQAVNDETVRDEDLEQAVKEETADDKNLEQAGKDENVADKNIEQSAKDETDEDLRLEQTVKDQTVRDGHLDKDVKDDTAKDVYIEQAVEEEMNDDKSLEQSAKDEKVVDKLLKQSAKDETDKDEHLEQAFNNETVRNDLHSDRKVITAKTLLQRHVDMNSQDWSVLLPEELVLILFKFLKPGDILATSQTCRLWRRWGENGKLWEQICKEAGLELNLTAANLRALERRSKKSNIEYSTWKENFLKPYKIAKKFRREEPQVLTVEISNDVNQIKTFNNKIVITFKNNNSLYVFCALTGRLMHELIGHTSNVEVIEIDKHFIVSGCLNSVKVWNVDTGSCRHTLQIHMGYSSQVTCLQIHGAIVVSGSCDGTLRMWDVFAGISLKTMRGHNRGSVNHLQFDGRLVVSVTWPGSLIKIWDPQTGECLRFLDPEKVFNSLKLHGDHLLVMHPGGWTTVWGVDTGVCRHTLWGINTGYIELLGDLLVCRSGTSAKIWSLSTGACLHALVGLQKLNGGINGIGVSNKFVVTSSWDGKVILWDVKTGKFIRELFMLESGEKLNKMEMKETKIVFVIYVHAQCSRGAHSKLLVLNFDTNEED